jgi:pantothenate kinase
MFAANECFMAIRSGGEVRYPIYNRLLHDPEPDAGLVRSTDKIIVIEGNYLLLDEPSWQRFQDIFAVRIFIKADPQALLESLVERHLRGGKTLENTLKHVQDVDLPNAQRILAGYSGAHVIIHKKDAWNIERIEWVREVKRTFL